MDRVIMHVDLDAFYASLEELRHPEIRGRPVAVCVYSGRTPDSGAVSTSNYAARTLGIHAGMPIKNAKRLAEGKDVVFLPVDMEHYTEVSDRIMDLLEEHADVFEQRSIDEAYMDVTEGTSGSWDKAADLARRIQEEVREHEGITCSVGIGPNRFVAKMASGHKKPEGLTVVKPEDAGEFLRDMPVIKLHGIGGKTAGQLSALGIETAGDLAAHDVKELEREFGANKAKLLKDKANGVDATPVKPHEKKQMGSIGTLKENTRDIKQITGKLEELSKSLEKKTKKKDVTYRTVSIIAIDTHLKTHSRSETIQQTKDINEAVETAKKLFKEFLEENPDLEMRRVGLRVSNLTYPEKDGQKSLVEY